MLKKCRKKIISGTVCEKKLFYKGMNKFAVYYIGLKIFNLLNVIVQMVFLHFIFGWRFFSYGFDFVSSLINQENPFFLTSQFPIITFCDFFVHQNLRKIYYNTVQCLLPINVFIEKVFLIIWFWYYLLIFLTLANIISWVIEYKRVRQLYFLVKYLSIRYKLLNKNWNIIKKQIESNQMKSTVGTTFRIDLFSVNMPEVRRFYDERLGKDVVIVLYLIKSVAGSLIFMDFLGKLWDDWNVKKNNNYDVFHETININETN